MPLTLPGGKKRKFFSFLSFLIYKVLELQFGPFLLRLIFKVKKGLRLFSGQDAG